jgi:hypothetical protein
MKLLDNAILSIQIGLKDIDNPDAVISAIRNLHAGILLLFKEKLLRYSPSGSNEVLLKQRIVPRIGSNGDLVFVGKGRNTVDTAQIKERFEELGIQADWKQLDDITKLRNNVEHYYSDEPAHIMQEVAAKSFVIIRDFLVNELAEDPLNLLGETVWKKLLSAKEVYDRERGECKRLMDEIDWSTSGLTEIVREFSCDVCASDLLAPEKTVGNVADLVFACRSCGHRMPFSECAEELLESALASDIYRAYKDGEGPLLYQCPDCGKNTFLADEDRCVVCGYKCEYEECSVCGEPLGPEDQDNGGLCGYHAYTKDRD